MYEFRTAKRLGIPGSIHWGLSNDVKVKVADMPLVFAGYVELVDSLAY